jgi:vacuolar protein-sorting-associated protein 4
MDTNNLCNQAIDLVQKAVAADDKGEYELALSLYRDALSRFAMAIKYEQNPKRKELLTSRAEDYMERAEQLKKNLNNNNSNDKSNSSAGNSSATSSSKNDTGPKDNNSDDNKADTSDDNDPETKKLRGALAAAIVSEKPNVHVSIYSVFMYTMTVQLSHQCLQFCLHP